MRAVQKWWDSVVSRFFEPTTVPRLGLIRALYCFGLALSLFIEVRAIYGLYHSQFSTYFPIPVFKVTGFPLIGYSPMMAMCIAMIVLMVLAGAGIAVRVSCLVSCVLGFFVFGTISGFTKPYPDGPYVFHYHNIVLIVLAVFAIAPGIGDWGWRQWFGSDKGTRWRTVSSWPLNLIGLILAIAYFGSGYCKLVTAGLTWANGHTLQAYFLDKYLMIDSQLSYLFAGWYWPNVGLSIATLVLEIFFLCIFLVPRRHWLVALILFTGFTFHTTIRVVMEITGFLPFFILTYLIFIDWFLPTPAADEPDSSQPDVRQPSRGLVPSGWVKPMCAISGIFFMGIVLGRVEFWPLSDYRVFQQPNHYTWLEQYRLRFVDDQGEVLWVHGHHLGGSQPNYFVLDRYYAEFTWEHAHLKGDELGLPLLEQVRRHMELPGDRGWQELQLVKRTIDRIDGRFEDQNTVLASIPVDTPAN